MKKMGPNVPCDSFSHWHKVTADSVVIDSEEPRPMLRCHRCAHVINLNYKCSALEAKWKEQGQERKRKQQAKSTKSLVYWDAMTDLHNVRLSTKVMTH